MIWSKILPTEEDIKNNALYIALNFNEKDTNVTNQSSTNSGMWFLLPVNAEGIANPVTGLHVRTDGDWYWTKATTAIQRALKTLDGIELEPYKPAVAPVAPTPPSPPVVSGYIAAVEKASIAKDILVKAVEELNKFK